MLWLLLVGWVVLLNAADWSTTAAVLARAGSHEGNPLQATLFAHGGPAVLAGYKVLVIVVGALLTWLGFRLGPRFFVVLMAACDLLVALAVANNVFWLVQRYR